jgi:hypothetical protein
MGALRLFMPFIAIALETKYKNFGRKNLLVGSLGATMICFIIMFIIDAFEYGEELRVVGTGFVLCGYVIQAGFVWIAYKLYTTELFPTVIRSIALSTFRLDILNTPFFNNKFSITSQIGSIIGPQLIYIRKYWHSAPYLGVVVALFFATVFAAVFLPETKSELLHDTVHDAKRRRLAFEKKDDKSSTKLLESN